MNAVRHNTELHSRITMLNTGKVRFRAIQVGKGPDIVWIPGGDATAEYWDDQLPFFSDRFRCTSYDPRGSGQTMAPDPPWTIEAFAADCAALIDRICTSPVIVIGLSMGGLIAQQLAIDSPHLVRTAIPMGTAARIGGFTRDWMKAEIAFLKAGHRMPSRFAACHYAAFAYPADALGNPKIWRRIRSAYETRFGSRDPAMQIAQWQACLDFDCRDKLPECTVPIHAVAFSQDVQTPPPMVGEVSRLAAKGHFHEIPGLGHVSFARHQPAIVAELLKQIISDEVER